MLVLGRRTNMDSVGYYDGEEFGEDLVVEERLVPSALGRVNLCAVEIYSARVRRG